MSIANWLNVNPTSGSGDGVVSISSKAEYTGREARSTILTWTAANVSDVKRTVNQAGKPEHVTMPAAVAVEKTGKMVTISGVSNSKKLTFSLGKNDIGIELLNNYIVNGAVAESGVAISGDPGATAAYDFSIEVSVPFNSSTTEKVTQLIVTDNGGNRATCTITSAAGDAFVTIAEGDINLDYLGTPVTVQVKSNTSWAIS